MVRGGLGCEVVMKNSGRGEKSRLLAGDDSASADYRVLAAWGLPSCVAVLRLQKKCFRKKVRSCSNRDRDWSSSSGPTLSANRIPGFQQSLDRSVRRDDNRLSG